jgi:hypothetical protein
MAIHATRFLWNRFCIKEFSMDSVVEPWNPRAATENIREMAKHPAFSIAYKLHAVERLEQRGLIQSDVLFLLKNGFVLKHPQPAKTSGYYRYEMQGVTPNSDSRKLSVVVIPNYNQCSLKVVTIMWLDESQTIAGTLIGL